MSSKQEINIEDLLIETVRAKFVGQMITVENLRKPRLCTGIEFGYAEMSDTADLEFAFADGHFERVSLYGSVKIFDEAMPPDTHEEE